MTEYILFSQEKDVTGAADEFKYRVGRAHTFTLDDGTGSKQAFELSTFCVTTVAYQAFFKAKMNEQHVANVTVSACMLSMQDIQYFTGLCSL